MAASSATFAGHIDRDAHEMFSITDMSRVSPRTSNCIDLLRVMTQSLLGRTSGAGGFSATFTHKGCGGF